jgi:hypothetical protein
MQAVTLTEAPSGTPLARIIETEGAQATYPFESAIGDNDTAAGTYQFNSSI